MERMKQSTITKETSTTPEATQKRVSESIIKKGKAAVAKTAQALERLRVDYIPHGGLKPNPYNPNRQSDHDFQLLCQSMTEDGFTQPIVAVVMNQEHLDSPKFKGNASYSLGDLVIVDGEHRWRAAGTLGLTEVPVVVTPMTPDQMRIATLRHNRARAARTLSWRRTSFVTFNPWAPWTKQRTA